MKYGVFAVGFCTMTFILHGNRSLKGKRAILNRIKSRTRNEFNVSIAEVGDPDRVDRAVLAVSSVANDKVYVEGQLNRMVDFIDTLTEAEMIDVNITIDLAGNEDALL